MEKLASQRIPMQAVGDCQAWQMPEFGDKNVAYRAQDGTAETQTLASRLVPFDGKKPATPPKPEPRTQVTTSELEQLIADAETEGRERGYQEGLLAGQAEGHAEGLQQGLQAASEQMQALQATFAEMAGGLPEAMSVHNNELQNALVDLVAKVAGAVVQRELSLNATAIQEVVNTALAAVNVPDKPVAVFVSQQDYQLLKENAAVKESVEGIVEANDWQLKVDETLSAGDCRVNTMHASIDYTVAQRMEQALAALYANLKT